jgi:RNAse (barnase) inhibitor barstar
MDERRVYAIDGASFSTLEGFWDEVSEKLIPGEFWGRNLDAFNDILYGGFGTPEEGFVLVWKNSSLSKERLGHAETARWYEDALKRCHPSGVARMREGLARAQRGEGPTLFDWLVEIITDENHRDVELRLK